MFKNNLKIAWRNLMKDRRFTFLNLIGLATGLACALLIYLWVDDEMSFDKFHDKDSQIYQLMEYRKAPDRTTLSDESSGILGEVLATKIPEIEYAAAVAPAAWFQKFTLSIGEKNLKATGQYVGKDYFNILSFPFIEGKGSDALSDKNSIVVTEDLARKLFNTTDNVIGKRVRFQHDKEFIVSAVLAPLPHNSSEQFDFVLSFEYYKDIQPWVKSWDNTGPHNYILLKKGTDINVFNKKIEGVIRQNSNDTTRTAYATLFSGNYLKNTFSHGAKTGSKTEYVKLFSIIAIFILAIACINFMNLSTAKATGRGKEVGIKKVVGADRPQLIFQFLIESVLLTLLAVVFALLMVWLLLPQFNQLTGKQIILYFSFKLVLAVLGITLFTGIVSGSYPALYLSGFNPIAILKGRLRASFGEVWARKGLVVFQFSITVILIVSVLVVYKQISLIQSVNLGYNKDNIIRFNAEGKIAANEEAFVNQLKTIPGVVNASYTFHNMVGRNYGGDGFEWEGKDPNGYYYFEGMSAGYNFTETMGMQIIAGRTFSKNFGNEAAGIVLNEAAAALMNLKDPVGRKLRLFGNEKQIIGIVKDFHFESLHESVKPLYITLEPGGNQWDKVMVKIKADHQKETIARIEEYYTQNNPGFPFDFNFLDEAYQKQYATEKRVSVLSGYFAGLAILISCLGLFGLAAFTAQRRQKEIGIRKIVGASISSIFVMLSKDFLQLVMIAILIAFPLSWFAMNKWLQSFAYKVNIGATVFLVAGLSIIGITILTISFQAIKAAIANPVKSLRTE